MATIPITKRGAEKLKAELHRLKTVDRPAVIAAIAEARAQGTTTIESKTNFLGGGPVGAVLVGEAIPVKIGKRLSVWQTRIRTEAGEEVALVTQTQMVLWPA